MKTMTKPEFDALRKLSNKIKKHVDTIGKCTVYDTSEEHRELFAAIETATDFLNYAQELYYKYR